MKKTDSQQLERIREILRAPIPDQYLTELSSGLTEINFSYQLQRMDDAFGLAGWSRKSRTISVEKVGVNGNSGNTQWEATAEVIIKIPILGRTLNNFGSSSMDVRGDAMKGAVTAATSKCFQELGIGWEIYARKPEPKVWGKSAITIFRQGFILGFDAAAEGLDRAGALQDFTAEFEAEVKLSMTKPNGGEKA